ncbi:MAG: alanine--tRNA ligase [Bradymonadales bacterium]|nr:MAG: alanine--tRNA ligase [Bradymonadales bacterium]
MSNSVNEIREKFLSYFESKGHQRQRSSPLIPSQDPTLLFTNAGMVQFKDYFTGKETAEFSRVTTCQKCVRAGGKHNDLESVGFTKRHHTFFEMLGNFSFGDYFKKEAIEFAWEFLTEVLKLPKDRLWASVFEEDDEAFELWQKTVGLPKDRVVRMGLEDNFWAMGETGPCGPCSEIYFDRGPDFGKPGESIFDGGERYLEVWNLVFMQYESFSDGSRKPLPKPSVDTGMGLERLASILQDCASNYEIDSMNSILSGFERSLAVSRQDSAATETALRVLTDHIRSVSFLISDGVQPSNEGRGYVLRRILRRAVRYGRSLGQTKPFFHHGVKALVKEMGDAYPELKQNRSAIEKIIFHEEEKFFETLDSGLKLLEEHTQNLPKSGVLSGELAFQLYDTYGFPLDLTESILREKSLSLDQEAFDRALERQRERSRASWKGAAQEQNAQLYQALAQRGLQTKFTGYQSLEEDAQVLSLIQDGKELESLNSEGLVQLVIDRSPFYAESGGQVGDRGLLRSASALFEVEDCLKPAENYAVLVGRLREGVLRRGDAVKATVDRETRMRTRIHHTMTHVLHAGLHRILGDHVKQAGSLVCADYLRFDFSHFKALSKEELLQLEEFCNQRIRENPKLEIREEKIEDALASGAKAFFEDKYSSVVRVLRIGDFSIELCGGTHAESLAEAGLFKIVQESSVASGVRRIVAVTGQAALDHIQAEEKLLEDLAEKLKAPKKELLLRVEKLLKERAELQKKLQQRSHEGQSKDWKSLMHEIQSRSVILDILEVDSAKELREFADDYLNRMKEGLVVLGFKKDGKASVIVNVSKSLASQFEMKKFVDRLGKLLDGKGGGRPDFAQVGGQNTDALTKENLLQQIEEHLKALPPG